MYKGDNTHHKHTIGLVEGAGWYMQKMYRHTCRNLSHIHISSLIIYCKKHVTGAPVQSSYKNCNYVTKNHFFSSPVVFLFLLFG